LTPALQPKPAQVEQTARIDAVSSTVSGMTESPQARQQAALSTEASVLDADGQRDLAQLLAFRPDSQASAPRPSPIHRPAKPLADGALPQVTVDDVGAQPYAARAESEPSPGQRLQPGAQPGLTPAGEAVRKPAAPDLQAAGVNPLVPSSPVEEAGFGDAGRFQSLLAADGAPIDGERFEPAAVVGVGRSSTSSAPAAPGVQIGLQIARSLANGVERLTVHLHPAELGSVDIQLNFEDGGRLTAQIVAERPETLELLQRDSRLLERSLGDNGLKLINEGLSFSLKQDQQQQQAGQQFQQQSNDRQTTFEAGRAYDDAPAAEDQPLARRVDGLRLLDIRT
jgi:hypothetical protein